MSRPEPKSEVDAGSRPDRGGQDIETTVIARTVTRVVVPLVLVLAVALLLQGHNLPGGGFIAGVLTAVGFGLLYVVFGREFVRRTVLRVGDGSGSFGGPVGEYVRAFTFGLALAAGAGVAFVFLGGNFLAQVVVFVEHVPLYGEIELPSALAFDLGVYFVVVGGLLTILSVVGAE